MCMQHLKITLAVYDLELKVNFLQISKDVTYNSLGAGIQLVQHTHTEVVHHPHPSWQFGLWFWFMSQGQKQQVSFL